MNNIQNKGQEDVSGRNENLLESSEVTSNTSINSSAVHTQSANVVEQVAPQKKTNRGCWIVAGIGCALSLLIIGVLFALFILILSAGSGSYDSSIENVIKEGTGGKIAVIPVEGVITQEDSSGLFSAVGATPSSINSQIDKALEDNTVKAIILKVNSPGGEVVASDLIYRKVKAANEEKPVVTWMSSLGASGGYFVAAGSEKIVAHPSCITGSIGTILQISNMDRLYEMIGIDYKTFKSGKHKDSEQLFLEEDSAEKQEAESIYQSLVDETYYDFVKVVAEGRNMDIEEVKKIADGRIYSGYQAKSNGLIDEVGYMEDAVAIVEELVGESDMQLIEYTVPTGFFSSFSSYQHQLLETFGFTKKEEYTVGLYYLLEM